MMKKRKTDMVLELLDPGIFLPISDETYDDRRSQLTLLHKDEDSIDVLIQAFGEDFKLREGEINIEKTSYVRVTEDKVLIRSLQDASLATHPVGNEKYITIEDEMGKFIVPFKGKNFPKVVVGNHLRERVEDSMGEYVATFIKLGERFYDEFFDLRMDFSDDDKESFERWSNVSSAVLAPIKQEIEEVFGDYESPSTKLKRQERELRHILLPTIDTDLADYESEERASKLLLTIAKGAFITGPARHTYMTSKEKFAFTDGGSPRRINALYSTRRYFLESTPKTAAVIASLHDVSTKVSAGVFRGYGLLATMGAMATDHPIIAATAATYTLGDVVINKLTETQDRYGMGLVGLIRHKAGADEQINDEGLSRNQKELVAFTPYRKMAKAAVELVGELAFYALDEISWRIESIGYKTKRFFGM